MPRSDETKKLDCFTKVITPENIQFEYNLAGPFQRLPAYLTDLLIWNASFIALCFLGLFLAGIAGMASPSLGEIGIFLLFVIYFVVSWFYGVFFETYYNGRTPGKAIFKLRAISVDGRPINGMQAAIRNLLRLADVNVLLSLQIFNEEWQSIPLFPTMAVGLVVMILTSRMQRIGDLAAGTMVISENRKYTPWNLQPDDLRAFGLAELIPPTFSPSSSLAQSVGLYMENRQKLGISRREEIAGRVAKTLIRRFELLPNTGHDLLMCALYVKIFLSDVQQSQGLEALRRTVQPQFRMPFPGSSAPQSLPGLAQQPTNVSSQPLGNTQSKLVPLDSAAEQSRIPESRS